MSLKNVVIGIAIIILTISVVIYGVHTIYNDPEFEDFCGDKSTGAIQTELQCLATDGKWTSYDGERPMPANEKPEGWCDINFTCRENYETTNEKYQRNIFLIALPLGILIIALGIMGFGLEAVGVGLGGGGVGIILWGVGGYWQYGSDLMKFILSLIGLVAVILLAYWFNKRI
ncbi:hypothetical protein KAR91_66010, partial [Candidatus Pacearchaeota archaeon]|nr:hypothetical protein [Candidatus Pacearchaeota archaeon]